MSMLSMMVICCFLSLLLETSFLFFAQVRVCRYGKFAILLASRPEFRRNTGLIKDLSELRKRENFHGSRRLFLFHVINKEKNLPHDSMAGSPARS
jgi:hypothetical protein